MSMGIGSLIAGGLSLMIMIVFTLAGAFELLLPLRPGETELQTLLHSAIE